jgi:hypothetical protein
MFNQGTTLPQKLQAGEWETSLFKIWLIHRCSSFLLFKALPLVEELFIF